MIRCAYLTSWTDDRFPRSSEKRDWCCGNFQRGCAATTLSPKGCATDCIVNGESRTCQEISGNCNAGICHQRFSWRWSCIMLYSLLGIARQMFNPVQSCPIQDLLKMHFFPRCRSGSTGPASTSLEFTRTLVSSLTAPFRHLPIRRVSNWNIVKNVKIPLTYI